MIERLVRRLDIDNLSGTLQIELHDGTLHRAGASRKLAALDIGEDFIRTSYDTVERTLTLVAPDGDAFVLEVFDGSTRDQRAAGRPIAYLDQNKWIALAQATHSPHVLPHSEVASAMKLVRLAQEGRVILPISSGNMLEVAYTDGPWRRNVGRLMLRLSRGWLMTHPLITRRAELFSVLSPSESDRHLPNEVFTLDPTSFYDPPFEEEELASEPNDEWSNFERVLVRSLSAITAFAATLILEERLREPSGRAASLSWARTWQTYAEMLGVNIRARANARVMTRAWFLFDLWSDFVRVATASGRSVEELDEWFVERAESDLAQLPYLGRMREVLHNRVMNPADKWKPGDLVDMLYLPYAAGYADFVVAEKKTTHYLNQVQKSFAGGAKLMSSLFDLVEAIEAADPPSPAPAA